MANTYELIKGETLTGVSSTYTFSAIPSTYTDLMLRVSLRTADASFTEVFTLRFNGISTSTHSYTAIAGVSGTAQSFAATSETSIRGGVSAAASNTASTFASAEVYIPSYRAGRNKPVGAFSVSENNTVNDAPIQANAGYWRNTAAITSITIASLSGSGWRADSSFYLYGIKNS